MEPERKIEKLLRAYAKKRRDTAGAPQELHPATRRLLQGEVACQAPKPGGGAFFHRVLATLRPPRLAFAVCAAAIAALVAALVLPVLSGKKANTSSMASAKNDFKLIGATAGNGVRTPQEESAGGKLQSRSVREASVETPPGAVPAKFEPPNAPRARTQTGASPAYETAAAADASALTPSAELADRDALKTSSGSIAQSGALKSAFANTQRYVRVDSNGGLGLARKAMSAPAQASSLVLASFQVEQNEEALRIVDQDGSVYSGFVQVTGAASSNGFASDPRLDDLKGKEAQGGAAGQPLAQNYSFRVSGTNLSLKQNVLFNGNLLAAGPAQLYLQTNGAGFVGGQLKTIQVNPRQLPLANVRVSGTALIDNRNELQIDAVPAGP